MKKCNIYKPGTAKYYKDVLHLILFVTLNYDGYNPQSACSMKGLVDDIGALVRAGLEHKKLYYK